jgi:hypothetical protein
LTRQRSQVRRRLFVSTILQHTITEVHRIQQGLKQSFLAILLQKATAGRTFAVDGCWPRIIAPCIKHSPEFEARGGL